MHADETRVSQAFRSMEGGADSQEVLNPPETAGLVDVLHQVPIAATAPIERTATTPVLSEAQLDAFWAGIVANLDAARRVARKIVPRQDVDDVVHSAALRFIESLQGLEPSPFPATDGQLRALFLDIVRRYAIDCVRDSKRPPLPIHSGWGVVWEPVVSGHNVADRELDTVFARNDEGQYDAPAAAARRDQDDVNQLHQILKRHLDDRSQAQREILVERFYKEGKRADIAARRGISASTYDNHRQAAFKALRDSLAADVNKSTGVDRSIWYDRIEELIERRAAREQGRSASTKGKRSSSEGKSGTFEGKGRNPGGKRRNSRGERRNSRGERRNSRGERRNSRGERRNVEGEHRPLKGERSNSAHERGHNVSAGAADEPFAGTSPAARSEPELAGRSL
jgi:RNA polymerase sigma factor (sigma-70 family)